jgi:hypothetical protein
MAQPRLPVPARRSWCVGPRGQTAPARDPRCDVPATTLRNAPASWPDASLVRAGPGHPPDRARPPALRSNRR